MKDNPALFATLVYAFGGVISFFVVLLIKGIFASMKIFKKSEN